MWIPLTAAIVLLGALPPGRYEGRAEAGRVMVDLGADGRARVDGVAYRWRVVDDALVLEGATGTFRMTIDGDALVGPPFGRLALRPVVDWDAAPASAPTSPPAAGPDLTGTWRYEGPRATVALTLTGDGRYRMIHGAAASETPGVWRGEPGALTLTPDGGAPLRYRARAGEGALILSGGDLPFEVRLTRLPEADYHRADAGSGADIR